MTSSFQESLSEESQFYVEILENMYHSNHIVNIPSGEKVSLSKSYLWLVVRGVIKVQTLTQDGELSILGLVSRDEVFGQPLSISDPYEAYALGNCDLLPISLIEIEQNPTLSISIFNALRKTYQQTEMLLSIKAIRGMEDRIKSLFIFLAERYGRDYKDGIVIDIRLTHQEIANLLTTTRVTVTRIMSGLKESKWLILERSKYVLKKHSTI